MNESLPIIESCDNCGACCKEQQSPPGYGMLLNSLEDAEQDEFFKEDVERIKSLPDEAMHYLRQHMEQVLAGNTPEDRTCIWLDRRSMKCKFHEYRPSICREFEIGSDDCRDWRREFEIN